MDRWTCGCGRANFSVEHPCLLCGAPAPTATPDPDPAAITLTAPDERWRLVTPSHVVAAVVLVMAVSAVVWFGTRSAPTRPATLAAADKQAKEITPFETTTTAPPVLSPLDLVLVKPPRDFQEISVPDGKNGPFGLADFEDPAERKLLSRARFTGGYEHVWGRIGAPDVIAKDVLDFEDEDHAKDLYNTLTQGETPLPGNQIPGAVIASGRCGCLIRGEAILYRKGRRVFAISVATVNHRFIPAEATALALEQYKVD